MPGLALVLARADADRCSLRGLLDRQMPVALKLTKRADQLQGLPQGLDAAFTEASVLYALTLAEIHGIHPEDIERRRLLVQTVLIGDSAIAALNKGADKTVSYWGKQIVKAIPMSAVDKANKVLGPRFITKYGTKQGVLVLSKQIPLGLGIGVGAFSNHMIGRTIVGTARRVFGPAPEFLEPRPDSVVVGGEWVQAAGAERFEIGGNQSR